MCPPPTLIDLSRPLKTCLKNRPCKKFNYKSGEILREGGYMCMCIMLLQNSNLSWVNYIISSNLVKSRVRKREIAFPNSRNLNFPRTP